MSYPVQGELGSDPCPHVFLVKLSDTESSFRYKDGFFIDSGCKTFKTMKSEIYFVCNISHVKHTSFNKENCKYLINSSYNIEYSQVKRSQSSPCTQFHSLALPQKKTKLNFRYRRRNGEIFQPVLSSERMGSEAEAGLSVRYFISDPDGLSHTACGKRWLFWRSEGSRELGQQAYFTATTKINNVAGWMNSKLVDCCTWSKHKLWISFEHRLSVVCFDLC